MRNECTWSLFNRFVSFAIKLSIASTCYITKHCVINQKGKCWSWTNNIYVIRCEQQSTCNNVNMVRWRDASSRAFMQTAPSSRNLLSCLKHQPDAFPFQCPHLSRSPAEGAQRNPVKYEYSSDVTQVLQFNHRRMVNYNL